jgi:hypothetical protein
VPPLVRTDPIASEWEAKPGGGVRRLARLSERDGRRWHGLTGRVAPLVEGALPANVLANRVVGGGAGFALEPVGLALRRTRRATSRFDRAPVVLRADVRSFYASVSPTVLAATLTCLGASRCDAHEAAAMLDGWGSHGYPGLPIGPPGSAVLANAVLRPADDALGRFRFLRWVDDYLVAAASDRAAEEALERIEETLSRLSLALNRSKTVIEQRNGMWPGGRHGPASLASRRSAGTIAAP